MKRRLVVLLMILITAILSVAVALGQFDPLGAYRYYCDLRTVQQTFTTDHARGFVIPPGTYRLSNWTFTMLTSGERHTPGQSPQPACRLVLLGDSVTFGLGVNDDQTWANLVALARPDLEVINTGLPWYDVWSAVKLHDVLEGDWYVYLVIDNDADHTSNRALQAIDGLSAIRIYAHVLTVRQQAAGGPDGAAPVPDDFWPALDLLLADSRVIVIGLRGTWLAQSIADSGRPIQLVSAYTERLSWADAHPNAEGHRQIAEQVLPLLPPEVLACP